LSYLQKFDIDFLKIDQSFVRNLSESSKNLSLCKAIIVMAHELGIRVIAEGVETAEQRDLLIAAGCDYGQGYLFSRPCSPADFDRWLHAGSSSTSPVQLFPELVIEPPESSLAPYETSSGRVCAAVQRIQ
jgi:EAL domain-containing protein (putative c-di-GMP-specific phosphodiesterase class I)